MEELLPWQPTYQQAVRLAAEGRHRDAVVELARAREAAERASVRDWSLIWVSARLAIEEATQLVLRDAGRATVTTPIADDRRSQTVEQALRHAQRNFRRLTVMSNAEPGLRILRMIEDLCARRLCAA